MNLTRVSLFSVTLYSALLVILFWWGSTVSDSAHLFDFQSLGIELWSMPMVFFGVELDTSSVIAKIIGSFLTFQISLEVARLAIKGVIYMERTYMPSVIFVLISSSYYNITSSLPALISTLLFTLAFTTLYKGYLVKHIITRNIFIASVNMGLAVLFMPSMLYFTPLLILYLVLFRNFDIREWITAIVGVALPVALGFLYLWVFNTENLASSFEMFCNSLQLNDGSTRSMMQGELNAVQYTFIGITLLLFVLSILRFRSVRKNYKRRSALGLRFFIYFSLWAGIIILASPVRCLYMMPILALPLSIVIPSYYAAKKSNFFSNSLYFLLLLSAIAIHLVGWL